MNLHIKKNVLKARNQHTVGFKSFQTTYIKRRRGKRIAQCNMNCQHISRDLKYIAITQ